LHEKKLKLKNKEKNEADDLKINKYANSENEVKESLKFHRDILN
jgi:hypothetical protein